MDEQINEYFKQVPEQLEIFTFLITKIDHFGKFTTEMLDSKITLTNKSPFAEIEVSDDYLKLNFTIDHSIKDHLVRSREENRPGKYTHFVQLYNHRDLTPSLITWLQEAFVLAGEK